MSVKEIKPDYYDSFRCIGGKCSFTCCQEWKIAVDTVTKKKWRSVPQPKGLKEAGRLPDGLNEHSCLNKFIVKKDDQDVIGLLPDMKCPFLEENRLCRLVLDHGEEMISKTCHEFPRETHKFTDRTEYALVSCCPEIVDRWKEHKCPEFTGLNYKDKVSLIFEKDTLKFIRDLCMYHLSDKSCDNRTNLLKVFFMILDLYKKLNNHRIDKTEIHKNDYLDTESIGELTKAVKELPQDSYSSLNERNELFLDMTENYAAEGGYKGYLTSLRQRAISLQDKSITETELKEFSVSLEKYEGLLRNYLVSETFSNLLIPGMEIRDMVLQFQWMMMEYAVILHALYLKWEEEHALLYETVRDMIVLISRLTGYDADDIEEYLESSFESPIWDFGYADFLLG